VVRIRLILDPTVIFSPAAIWFVGHDAVAPAELLGGVVFSAGASILVDRDALEEALVEDLARFLRELPVTCER